MAEGDDKTPKRPKAPARSEPRPDPRPSARKAPKPGAKAAAAKAAEVKAGDAKAPPPKPSPKPSPKPRARKALADLAGAAVDADQAARQSGQPTSPAQAEAISRGAPEAPPEAPPQPQPAINRGARLRINLALQGGGAHGAFTWGVLDRLLCESDIEIAGISGCSAGALNGAALKSGLIDGGPEAARDNLDWLWQQMGALPDLGMPEWLLSFLPGPAVTSKILEAALRMPLVDAASRMLSPYDLPLWDNPLRRVVERFSFDKVCAREGPAFFVSATNVRTGKIRVFSGDEITTDAILASACLPTLFRAVEILDLGTGKLEAYWDGGYSGNPALFPLFDPGLPDDIVIVNINPLFRDALPRSATEIENRVNEISFNASLLRELRAIGFVKRLIAAGQVTRGAMKDVQVHMIADDALMASLGVATKLLPTPALLAQLRAAGEAAADGFLARAGGQLGQATSVDLPSLLS